MILQSESMKKADENTIVECYRSLAIDIGGKYGIENLLLFAKEGRKERYGENNDSVEKSSSKVEGGDTNDI